MKTTKHKTLDDIMDLKDMPYDDEPEFAAWMFSKTWDARQEEINELRIELDHVTEVFRRTAKYCTRKPFNLTQEINSILNQPIVRENDE